MARPKGGVFHGYEQFQLAAPLQISQGQSTRVAIPYPGQHWLQGPLGALCSGALTIQKLQHCRRGSSLKNGLFLAPALLAPAFAWLLSVKLNGYVRRCADVANAVVVSGARKWGSASLDLRSRQLAYLALISLWHCKHEALKASYCRSPGSYEITSWYSVGSFEAMWKVFQKSGMMGPSEADQAALRNSAATDPLHCVDLPELPPNTYLTCFRLFFGPGSSASISVLQLVPFDLETGGDTSNISTSPHCHDVHVDPGMQRFRNGQCSTCGVAGRLQACKGCNMHGYCSRECAKTAWKEHKPLCVQHRAIVRAANSG